MGINSLQIDLYIQCCHNKNSEVFLVETDKMTSELI